MFGALTEKLHDTFRVLSKNKKITEDNVSDAIREVRLALLDADVNYAVAKSLIRRVKEKALGEEVLKSVSPGQQFIKIVHEELVSLMGNEEAKLNLPHPLSVMLLCGLQGSGKTTHAAKLANFLKKDPYNRKPVLVACDLQRPAAVEQLKVLGKQISVPVFSLEGEKNPVKVAKAALKEYGHSKDCDLLLFDTAGRLHVDKELMQELTAIKKVVKPHEVLFVANAATGQDAVKTAETFNEHVSITGSILTMLDSDTRGGAAISITEISGQPLKFEGTGEKIEDLQLFHPQSMADRILGMGDTINLVKKAQEHFSESEALELEKKIRKASFTYEDYLKQMQAVKKMGSLKGLLKMIPGASKLGDFDIPEKELARVEAMILSMTARERQEKDDMTVQRKRRIAKGAGVDLGEVNRLTKSFKQAKKLFKQMPNQKQMAKMMGGMSL